MTEKEKELLSQIQDDMSKLIDTNYSFKTNDGTGFVTMYKEFTENMTQKLIFDKFHRCDPTLNVIVNFDDIANIMICTISTDDPEIQGFLKSISTDIQELDF